MKDAVMGIVIVGIETLLIPKIYCWLKKRMSNRWLLSVLIVMIVLVLTAIIGSIVSVMSYHLRWE
ncbi:MAG: hypothetical protein K2G13_06215 [Muribaculaceae bacterium]|nr:hypothetical protein [Muribaculaceae bacterium]